MESHNIMIKTVFQVAAKSASIPIYKLPHLEDALVDKAINCRKFKSYVEKIDKAPANIKVERIEIISVELFSHNNVGFVNMRAITTEDGLPLPSYVFLRGDAVTILLLINNKMLLVRQYRVPLQKYGLESPAGMLDQEGDFTGVAAKEIAEETGIKITHEDLTPIGSYVPSGGGCDESIKMYVSEMKMPEEELKVLLDKVHGEGDHERIQLKLVDFTIDNVVETEDSKLMCLWTAYQRHKQLPTKKIQSHL